MRIPALVAAVVVLSSSTLFAAEKAEVSGTWKLTIRAITGMRESVMTIDTDNTFTWADEQGEVTGRVKVDGNRMTWQVQRQERVEMNFEYNVTVDGDSLNGTEKMGELATSTIEGKRE